MANNNDNFEFFYEKGVISTYILEGEEHVSIEFFPNGQSTESFESAEFNNVFLISTLLNNTDSKYSWHTPTDITEEELREYREILINFLTVTLQVAKQSDKIKNVKNKGVTEMRYLETNCYGLKPQYAEQITSEIKGDELQDLGVELIITTGCINGEVGENGTEHIIKDTVRIYVDNKLLGQLIINGTELSISPKYSLKNENFIQVSFATWGDHPLVKNFLLTQVPVGSNGLGESCYNFLVIHESDLDKAKEIILNKLSWKISTAIENDKRDKENYIKDIRQKYMDFID